MLAAIHLLSGLVSAADHAALGRASVTFAPLGS